MPAATYSTPEVCDAAGATYRQLDYWTRQGVIAPAVSGGKGSGNYRRWKPRQVATVAVLAQVARLGAMNRPSAVLRQLGLFLEDLPLERWKDTRILLDPDGEVWLLDEQSGFIGSALPPTVGTFIDLSLALSTLL